MVVSREVRGLEGDRAEDYHVPYSVRHTVRDSVRLTADERLTAMNEQTLGIDGATRGATR